MYASSFMSGRRRLPGAARSVTPILAHKVRNCVPRLLAALVLCVASVPAAQAQAQPFIGQLMLVPYNFCPNGWADAQGQLLSISQNQALFALIGTTYGGNGTTTFALPDLRGRVPVGVGPGPGLSNVTLGQRRGVEAVTLNTQQMPQHSHALLASTAPATHAAPAGDRVLAATQNAGSYVAGSANTQLQAGSIGTAGGSAPVAVVDPGLGMRWCIALQGIFPSRP